MTPLQIAECALAALNASHRDAKWLADAMLDAARPLVFDQRAHRAAMGLASKAAGVRDALAERIAALEVEVAAIVVDAKDDGGHHAHVH